MTAHPIVRRRPGRVVHAISCVALLLMVGAKPAAAQFVTSAGLFVASPIDAHTPRGIIGFTGMLKVAHVGARVSIGESGRDVVDGHDTTHVTYAWTADADIVLGSPTPRTGPVFEPYAFVGVGLGRWDPVHLARRQSNYSTGAGLTVGSARGFQLSIEARRRRMHEPYVVDGVETRRLTEGRLIFSIAFGR